MPAMRAVLGRVGMPTVHGAWSPPRPALNPSCPPLPQALNFLHQNNVVHMDSELHPLPCPRPLLPTPQTTAATMAAPPLRAPPSNLRRPPACSSRAVKSANILLTASGAAKLADCGFSKTRHGSFLSSVSLIGTCESPRACGHPPPCVSKAGLPPYRRAAPACPADPCPLPSAPAAVAWCVGGPACKGSHLAPGSPTLL